MPRGGRRQGTPGAQYANRTDLQNGPRQLPITTVPGQTYGEATQQREAQQAVPMGSGPLNSPAAPTAPMAHGDVVQAARDFNPPPVVPLGMPSLRPDEHVMTPPTPPPAPLSPAVKAAAALASLGENAPPQVKLLQQALNVAAQNGSGA